jgi:RIO kinase 1
MKTPKSLETLMDHGIIQEVIRPLMSGKEAQIYVVVAGGVECVAKVYKEAHQRTFKHRVEYTEGRRTRNSRDQRAASKRTRHGRKQDEAAWRNAEVDVIYRLRAEGVRVPEPINFADGVLVMELVEDGGGNPAPRLGDLTFEPDEATAIYRQLIQEVVRMLCAGVIHGDLSVFNVLMDAAGPVVIDFPQSTDPARNQSARKLLLRDVENLHRFLERFAPDQPRLPFGEEMWSLYESNRLTAETELSGDYQAPEGETNTEEVLALIDDANLDEQMRRQARGLEAPVEDVAAPKPRRAVVDFTKQARPRPGAGKRVGGERGARPEGTRSRAAKARASTKSPLADGAAAPKKTRRRRRRKSSAEPGAQAAARGSRSQTKSAEKPTGSSDVDRPKRRRRGRRSSSRDRSQEAGAGAQVSAKRPAKPATGARSDTGSGAAKGGAARPSRRRRRRPRAARSRDTS